MHQGAFIQKRGDCGWLEQCFGLGDLSNSKACWMCERNPEDLGVIDFESWMEWNLKLNRLAESFYLPGFVCDYIDLDVIHIVDLGILQYFLGSIAMELLVCLGGKNGENEWKDALTQLLRFIQISAKEVGLSGSPLNNLTIKMLGGGTNSSVARLKTKAVETRGIAQCFGYILDVFFPPQTFHERIRKECLDAILEFYKCLRKTWDECVRNTAVAALQSLDLYFRSITLLEFPKMFCFLFFPRPPKTLHCFG